MVWYVPPLSLIQSYADAGAACRRATASCLRWKACASRYSTGRTCLARGIPGPVLRAFKRMMAMRHYKRSQTVEGVTDTCAIEEVGLTVEQVEEMYRYLPSPTKRIVS